ncbi:MAG: hypothetical protein ACR2HS_05645 [Gammaproteobacteria bacterium]
MTTRDAPYTNSRYLHALKETGADPSKFHGHHPIHFIDTTLRK